MDIQHLAGTRHGDIGCEFPGQTLVEKRGDEQPGAGFLQQLRVILFQPDQLIQGVEGKCADARDLLELLRGHKTADIVHHRRGARTFPADDRIEQLALFIHQRAVDAEGGDRDAANRAGRECVANLPAALGEALQDRLQRPLVPGAVLHGDIAGVGRCGAGDNVPLAVNRNRPHVGGAAVEDQDDVFFHR